MFVIYDYQQGNIAKAPIETIATGGWQRFGIRAIGRINSEIACYMALRVREHSVEPCYLVVYQKKTYCLNMAHDARSKESYKGALEVFDPIGLCFKPINSVELNQELVAYLPNIFHIHHIIYCYELFHGAHYTYKNRPVFLELHQRAFGFLNQHNLLSPNSWGWIKQSLQKRLNLVVTLQQRGGLSLDMLDWIINIEGKERAHEVVERLVEPIDRDWREPPLVLFKAKCTPEKTVCLLKGICALIDSGLLSEHAFIRLINHEQLVLLVKNIEHFAAFKPLDAKSWHFLHTYPALSLLDDFFSTLKASVDGNLLSEEILDLMVESTEPALIVKTIGILVELGISIDRACVDAYFKTPNRLQCSRAILFLARHPGFLTPTVVAQLLCHRTQYSLSDDLQHINFSFITPQQFEQVFAYPTMLALAQSIAVFNQLASIDTSKRNEWIERLIQHPSQHSFYQLLNKYQVNGWISERVVDELFALTNPSDFLRKINSREKSAQVLSCESVNQLLAEHRAQYVYGFAGVSSSPAFFSGSSKASQSVLPIEPVRRL
jgi:hypothetical protein